MIEQIGGVDEIVNEIETEFSCVCVLVVVVVVLVVVAFRSLYLERHTIKIIIS